MIRLQPVLEKCQDKILDILRSIPPCGNAIDVFDVGPAIGLVAPA